MLEKKSFNNLFILTLLGVFLGLFLKFFAFDVLHISGSSMSPNLKQGDSIIINKLAYGIHKPFSESYIHQYNSPSKNEIVTFLHDNKIVIKRCVLTSGEHLDFLVDSQYYLLIDNTKIPLLKDEYDKLKYAEFVPEGYIFVLGDNYQESIDSRNYGFVSIKDIIGKAVGK